MQRLYHARIPEDTPVSNTSILNVIATDDDCYDKVILYSLLLGDLSSDPFPFEIDQHTGSIYVKHKLDYEKASTYRFRVKAANLDKITSSIVSVIIDITDINDNQPLIQVNVLNNYKSNDFNEEQEDFIIYIKENIRVGQVIGTILVRDSDSLKVNIKLSLKILSCWPLKNPCPIELDSGLGGGDESEKSAVGATNYLIRTSRPLDSESGDDKFTVILEARKSPDARMRSARIHSIVFISRRPRATGVDQSTSSDHSHPRRKRLHPEVLPTELPISSLGIHSRRLSHRSHSRRRSGSLA